MYSISVMIHSRTFQSNNAHAGKSMIEDRVYIPLYWINLGLYCACQQRWNATHTKLINQIKVMLISYHLHKDGGGLTSANSLNNIMFIFEITLPLSTFEHGFSFQSFFYYDFQLNVDIMSDMRCAGIIDRAF